MKRDTSICGDRIVMIVADSDNLQNHLKWIKSIVVETNEWISTEEYRRIDMYFEKLKHKALEEFDAIQSMKERVKNINI